MGNVFLDQIPIENSVSGAYMASIGPFLYKTHSCAIKLCDLFKGNHLNHCSYPERCCTSR